MSELRRHIMMQSSATSMYPIDARGGNQNATALMDVFYSKGFAANPDYMTYEECAAVGGIGTWFQGNTDITDFSAFQYFTGVIRIENSAFLNCVNLKSIVFPDSIQFIAGYAFMNTGIEDLVLPNSITTISTDVFRGCLSLLSICLPTSVSNVGSSMFRDCTSLRRVEIPANYTTIMTSAFSGCSALEEVVFLGDNIVTIDQYAFAATSLKEITIPTKVTSLPPRIFDSCTMLQNIYLPRSVTPVPSVGSISTFNWKAVPTIHFYCPSSMLEYYLADSTWTANADVSKFATY